MKLLAAALLAAATPSLAQDLSVRVVTLKSPALGEERTVLVLAPPAHDRSQRRYPVLYFTDGEKNLPLLATTARFLADAGRMPEVILVGVSHPDRTRDLTPTRGRLVQDGGGAIPFETSGGADRFLAFLADELVPWVEHGYRTEPFRILAGHSFGGLFALHAAAARPGFFQAIIAASPALSWDGDLAIRSLRAALARKPAPRGTIVFSMGDEGRLSDARFAELKELLEGAGPALGARALRLPGEDHQTTPFATYYAGLEEAFAGWTMPMSPEAIGPKGGLAAVERHYAALSRRLGFEVKPTERVLALAGLQALGDGDLDGAVRALSRATELHPDSAPSLQALGAAHEQAGHLGPAVDAYRRAWEVAREAKAPDVARYERSYARAMAARAGERIEPMRPGDLTIVGAPCDRYGQFDPDSRHIYR